MMQRPTSKHSCREYRGGYNLGRVKVLHMIETAEPGGAETVLVELAASLRDEFDSVGCVLQAGWTSQALAARGIDVECLPLSRAFDFGWIARFRRFIAERNIQLIHSHEFTTNCYATAAAKMANLPVICTVHGKNYYPDRYYRRAAYRWVARNADALVAVSDDLKSFITENIGIRPDRIRVIQNGVQNRLLSNGPRERTKRRLELGLPNNSVVCITVAALFEVKGYSDLLTAAQRVLASSPDVVFLLAGEGPLEHELKQMAERLHLGNRVRFLGFRHDIPELLAACDIFVLPSYSEGMPMAVLEAMSSGLPVIGTSVGGMPEVVEHGTTGTLIEPGRPDALADTIIDLAADPDRCFRFGNAGRRRIESQFSLQTMLGNYKNLYHEVLVGHSRDA
jgi:glycosyltransferase involved in cell wall biosynthesis